jgi:hypothetical protein
MAALGLPAKILGREGFHVKMRSKLSSELFEGELRGLNTRCPGELILDFFQSFPLGLRNA